MARTNIDIDEDACARVMHKHGFRTKREAVNFALREVGRVMTIEEALAMRGTGWHGDLDAMRENEHADWIDRD
jgi:Arc/MetJ family transcription regulator